jgi:hypothetical protein
MQQQPAHTPDEGDTQPVNILCMKWGSLYGPEYVNHLCAGVARHLKRAHRFICFTDDARGLSPDVEVQPLPEVGVPEGNSDLRWRKLAVFRQGLGGLSGTALFFDLDLVIVDSLEPLFQVTGDFLIIRDDDLFRTKLSRKFNPSRDRYLHSVGNSSVFRFSIGAHAGVLDDYLADPLASTTRFKNEQEYLSAWLIERGLLRYWPSAWCVSFKNACVPRHFKSFFDHPAVPIGARIVVFAGTPKMSDVLEGRGHRWYRRIGNVDWLRRAWSM